MVCWAYRGSERAEFPRLLTTLQKLPRKRLARSPSHPVHLSRSADSVFWARDYPSSRLVISPSSTIWQHAVVTALGLYRVVITTIWRLRTCLEIPLNNYSLAVRSLTSSPADYNSMKEWKEKLLNWSLSCRPPTWSSEHTIGREGLTIWIHVLMRKKTRSELKLHLPVYTVNTTEWNCV